MPSRSLLATALWVLQGIRLALCLYPRHATTRRELWREIAVAGGGIGTSLLSSEAPSFAAPSQAEPLLPKPLKMTNNRRASETTPFFVRDDSSAALSPKLVGVSSQSAIEYLASPPVQSVWLGEHHNSLRDHELQNSILKDLSKYWSNKEKRPLVVGLEAVQQGFQFVLDDYIAGKIDEDTLFQATEWKTRWFWPFDRYLPVFRFCREQKIPLLALSIDSESLERCEMGGLQALSPEEQKQYIPDGKGFNGFTSTTAFREYIAYEIKTSYELHDDMGILGTTVTGKPLDKPMSFSNFYASRILRDEAMATAAARWMRKNPEGRLVGLVGSDHVKFSCGVPARAARLLHQPPEAAQAIMLNPTAIDTARDASDVVLDDASQITLQIRFAAIAGRPDDPAVLRSVTGGDAKEDVQQAIAMKQVKKGNMGVLPVADFFWYSPRYKEVNGFQNNNYLM